MNRYIYKPNPGGALDQYTKDELEKIADAISVPDEWDDIVADMASAKIPTTNAPDWKSFRGGLYTYAFDDTTNEQVYLAFHILHDIKRGSKLYLHIHWSPGNNTDTGTVRWGFEYSIAKGHGQEAFPATNTVYVEQASDGTAYMHNVAELSDDDAIYKEDLEPDTVLLVRVFRDASHANDTFVGDAHGFQVDIHYQRDRDGTPNKAPDFYV